MNGKTQPVPGTTERPILFNGEMVRAILEGRKTVTRRPLKNQMANDWHIADPKNPMATITSAHPKKGKFGLLIRREIYPDSGKFEYDVIVSPFGRPGDRLWVRETFAVYGDEKFAAIHYRADRPHDVGRKDVGYKPSIHMPRWACRILLEITEVRVERLQHVSEEQARNEGISPLPCGRFHCGHDEQGQVTSKSAITAFAWVWNSINGEGGWAANPWVWVVEFKRVSPGEAAA